MSTVITRNGAKKKARGGLAPRTDAALVQQMVNVKSVLHISPLDLKSLSNQCLLLSKVLDSLVANNRKPNCRHDLLPLVQQVCKYKDKPEVRAALLVLLLSIKSAFRTEWLSALEVTGNDEIFSTLNLLFDSFTTSHEDLAQASLQSLQCGGSAIKQPLEAMNYLVSISNRFYPRLQVNAVFVAVQAKVGYEVLLCDFHVPHMHIQDRVRLYVSKADFIETATCLITPPQVNILVNGQQVEKRVTTGYLDVGPQMPSDVTGLVKVGANVLQVIGEFSGPYVIAVASSRTIQRSAKNTHLEDYVAPTKAASSEVDPSSEVDDEVVEGASRLSLRCPISHQRLVTPVKATTCRHLQCFDYDSFLEINEKRPAWRCPCCNRFTSLPDLRIDRKIEKVLKETDENIHEVIVSQDGSWVSVPTSENQSNSAADVIPGEGCEVGSEVIDLSDVADEELRQNYSTETQLPDRKPDKQTLLAINENRGNPSQGTNPVVRQRDAVQQPRIFNAADITTTAAQSSQSFVGPSWAGPHCNDGIAVNATGGVSYTLVPGTAEMRLLHSQPAPSTQLPPAANQNSQGNTSQSRTAPHLSSPAGPVNGYRTSTQLQQQPQLGVPSNTRNETENDQHLGQTQQQQWRGPGVPSHQLVTSTAQVQSSQQFSVFGSSQNPVSHSPHQTVGAGVHSQQICGAWGGPPPGSAPGAQVPGGDQTWRPGTIRMRGSMANPLVGHGVLDPSPRAALQQRCAFNTVPQYSDSVAWFE